MPFYFPPLVRILRGSSDPPFPEAIQLWLHIPSELQDIIFELCHLDPESRKRTLGAIRLACQYDGHSYRTATGFLFSDIRIGNRNCAVGSPHDPRLVVAPYIETLAVDGYKGADEAMVDMWRKNSDYLDRLIQSCLRTSRLSVTHLPLQLLGHPFGQSFTVENLYRITSLHLGKCHLPTFSNLVDLLSGMYSLVELSLDNVSCYPEMDLDRKRALQIRIVPPHLRRLEKLTLRGPEISNSQLLLWISRAENGKAGPRCLAIYIGAPEHDIRKLKNYWFVCHQSLEGLEVHVEPRPIIMSFDRKYRDRLRWQMGKSPSTFTLFTLTLDDSTNTSRLPFPTPGKIAISQIGCH